MPIADHALIGNTFSAALVTRDGTIDWCCLPHFDSGAVFCSLLDAHQGGCFRVGPAEPCEAERGYLEESAVLATEFQGREGRVRLTDFMPLPASPSSSPGTLVRRIEGLQGRLRMALLWRPTFDFARQPMRLVPAPGGCRAVAPGLALRLALPPALHWQASDDHVRAAFEVRAGEVLWIVTAHEGASPWTPADPGRLLDTTLAHWRAWNAQSRYRGPCAREVRLSARVLKLLTFAPTGAIVAAPTTSLPEAIGGSRNWDYRFCWLRDAALVLDALIAMGHEDAGERFFRWLASLWHPDRRLQIMYRLDGGQHLPEATLAHLEGYRGSRPVRVGNGAVDQLQLDVYGHVLDAAWVYAQARGSLAHEPLPRVLASLADEAARRWREPDQGIWEMPTPPAHHVSSKLMCWVALDRALKLAQRGALRGDVGSWQREREAVRQALHTHGFDARQGAFTQTFGGDRLDASVLLMPIVGFLPAHDPRMRSTVQRIREQLMDNGLVRRYRGGDGLAGGEGAFAICGFWMVDNLALQGRVDEAGAMFEHLLSFASDLGLMSEEIDPRSGELLGNYPQGYTHLAIIRSALALQRAGRKAAQAASR